MIESERLAKNERRRVRRLREYYRENFRNGASHESFLLWIAGHLADIYGSEDAVKLSVNRVSQNIN